MWAISQGNPAMEIIHFDRMGLDGLSLNPLTLLESRLLKGREGSSLLVHAPITLLLPHSLFFFSLSIFFFISMFPLFILIFHFFFFSLFFSLALLCISLMLASFLIVHNQGLFILSIVMSFTVLPLNYFCPGMGVLLRPPIGLSAA